MDFPEIRAAVFDFDGTLVDSMMMWTEIDIAYLGRYGCVFTPDLQTDIEGMSTDEMADYFRRRYGIPASNEEMIRDWTEMSRHKYLHEIGLKPFVRELLEKYRSQGVRMGIATSTELEIALPCLENHGILELFDTVATTTEAGRGKPSPEVYQLALRRLGAAPEEAAAFEDLPAGILAAKAAGIYTVAVHDAFSADRENEKRMLADRFIRDFSELL